MDLLSVRLGESPSARRVRLVATVAYDDRPRRPEEWWIEVPEEHAGSLSVTGSPWLAVMLPLAATLGEPLRLAVPADATLLANAPRILRLWREWYRERFPHVREVPVEAEALPPSAYAGPRETGAFFSGGVDSFYMILANSDPELAAGLPPIDRLITVWGFDVPLESPEEFRRLRDGLAAAAAELGRPLLDAATNVRQTRLKEARWGELANGGALASVGLALERRLGALCVAGSHYSGPVRPWGSHPETDPLFSTGATRVFHHACGVLRRRKIELLARSETALRHLHVCYRNRSADNCGNCHKCFVTMLTLDLAGAAGRRTTFPPDVDLSRVRRMYIGSNAYKKLYTQLAEQADEVGRADVAEAVRRCLARSARLRRVLKPVEWLRARPALRPVGNRLRARILAGTPIRD
jgi:hypothetical protein